MSFITKLFGGGTKPPKALQQPPIPPMPPDPSIAREKAAKLAAAEAAEKKARGRASTILTGGYGLLDEEETESSRRLLRS